MNSDSRTLATILRAHQGPYFDGVTTRCGCRRIVLGAQEWAEHVAEEIQRVERAQPKPHRVVAANCKLAQGKGYPISTGDVCHVCAAEHVAEHIERHER